MAISLTKPTVGGSEGTWGTTINTAIDDVQNALNGTAGTVAPNLTKLTINGVDVATSASDLTNAITGFVLEDGDGTEVTVAGGQEVKFVEGGGIDINWTDTSTGSDADPYDMTFTLNDDMRKSGNIDVYTGNTADYVFYDADVGCDSIQPDLKICGLRMAVICTLMQTLLATLPLFQISA